MIARVMKDVSTSIRGLRKLHIVVEEEIQQEHISVANTQLAVVALIVVPRVINARRMEKCVLHRHQKEEVQIPSRLLLCF